MRNFDSRLTLLPKTNCNGSTLVAEIQQVSAQ